MVNEKNVKQILGQVIESQLEFFKLSLDMQKKTIGYFTDLLNSDAISIHQFDVERGEFSLFDYYSLTKRDDVLISYKGPVTDVLLAEISRDIRDKFSDNPKISKKLFSVFIELAQNILYYSCEKISFGERNDSIGTILITKTIEHFTFACGNLVENQYIEDLVESCKLINSLDREKLREYKRETRSAPSKDRSKGAGIGLIQVALTSGNPLEVEARRVDDQFSFFSISVKIHP